MNAILITKYVLTTYTINKTMRRTIYCMKTLYFFRQNQGT